MKSNNKLNLKKNYFGIGKYTSKKILQKFGIQKITNNLLKKNKLVLNITNYVNNNFIVNKNLKNVIRKNINEKITISSYEGKRHMLKLPVNGQRTKTNSKTRKKNKK